jgi:queuosine precursor transporter
MINELLFVLHVVIVSIAAVAALRLGKSALIGVMGLLMVLANLFVLKQITLFGLQVTCADVYIVGSVFSLSLLQEYFGKKVAHKAIWISFFMAVLYVALSQIHLLYVPSGYDVMQKHFLPLLKYMPRVIAASFVSYLFSQYTLLGVNILLKKIFGEKKLVLRNFGALVCSQGVDTIIFSFLGLYGIVHSVLQIMIFSFVIKIVVITCTTPFTALAKRVFKKTGFEKQVFKKI